MLIFHVSLPFIVAESIKKLLQILNIARNIATLYLIYQHIYKFYGYPARTKYG